MDDLADAARPRSARAPPAQRDPAGRRQSAGLRHHLVRDGGVPGRGGRGAAPRGAAAGARLEARRRATPACSTSAAARASTARTAAAPFVKLDDFGRVSLITGATEIGQGSETVLAMIVAETLGVPLERVEVLNSDTSVKPWDVGAHASRTTFIAGNAARLAAEKLRAQLLAMAAAELEAPRRAAPRRRRLHLRRTTSRSGASPTIARRAPGTCAMHGPDAGGRGVLRSARRRCSTRTCAATCRPPTASPPRRWCSTWSEATGAVRVGVSSRPTTSAARSTRWPPRARSTAACTWGSATR